MPAFPGFLQARRLRSQFALQARRLRSRVALQARRLRSRVALQARRLRSQVYLYKSAERFLRRLAANLLYRSWSKVA